LLHVLHDDPRSVTREEIKAAFADGRLGDQDLDIPVLAGMRRITELLAELHPDDALAAEAGAADATGSAAVSRPVGMSVRLTELEERTAHLEAVTAAPPPPSPTLQDVTDLRTALARLEARLAERDTRLRQVTLLAAVGLVVAIAAVILAVLVH
jgi:hypothetical protein